MREVILSDIQHCSVDLLNEIENEIVFITTELELSFTERSDKEKIENVLDVIVAR